jgi:hypothetical protein
MFYLEWMHFMELYEIIITNKLTGVHSLDASFPWRCTFFVESGYELLRVFISALGNEKTIIALSARRIVAD